MIKLGFGEKWIFISGDAFETLTEVCELAKDFIGHIEDHGDAEPINIIQINEFIDFISNVSVDDCSLLAKITTSKDDRTKSMWSRFLD